MTVTFKYYDMMSLNSEKKIKASKVTELVTRVV